MVQSFIYARISKVENNVSVHDGIAGCVKRER